MFHCSLGYICFSLTFSLFNYQCVSGICERQDLRKIDIGITKPHFLKAAVHHHVAIQSLNKHIHQSFY